ncbi:mitochondrial E3 ubiquitin protein ligase 1 [Orussus abietinus]|uniref:mitochondrial E3 ubiquitin protein ligase 1 n=1 Tax=Orussus abietinus TaxID=222816 RepID=UPI0006251C45|nr:mitochondrial E3 ubiquitin protein ligase 1 [Orussus abietinus]
MNYLGELIVLGIDGIVFAICLKQYFHCRNAILSVKSADLYDVGPALRAVLDNSSDNKVDYIAIKGAVKPLGRPFRGVHNKDLTGVVQKITVKEHVVARSTAGFWSNQERLMQEVYNSVPFSLQNGRYQVEVSDALAAEVLDMDTVSDHFEPSVPTFTDHLWGFFTGIRQKGIQSTEELLREGTVITGIGELTRSVTKPDNLVLQPPTNGTPFYLTSMSVTALLRKLDERRRTYRWWCLIFGSIGLVIGGLVARRYWKDGQERRLAEELRLALENTRKQRRERVRDLDLREDQLCVVCRTNPREIILLPCGHVCLCEDCAENISNLCPICRRSVASKQAAYIV